MDKNTLSNYGWIVITVLILSVMIALATPFGSYIERAINNSTDGLFETNNSVINVAYKSTGVVPKIIEGAGQIYNITTATTPLTFRSSAKFDTFKEVRIDGKTVASENYIVTEGSTIITFTNEYAKTLTKGVHTLDVVSDLGSAFTTFTIKKIYTARKNMHWNGFNPYSGQYIWTDGTNIYYSCYDYKNSINDQYVLNESTSTWELKVWNITITSGENIWTDGTNIYYNNYVLDGNTWIKRWDESLTGQYIWTDGINIYHTNPYSVNSNLVWNKETDTWEREPWSGPSVFYGCDVWTDGIEIYYSYGSQQYVLNKETSTWEEKTWNGLTSFKGRFVWNDSGDIYVSDLSPHILIDGTWKYVNGLGSFSGYVWTSGSNYYATILGSSYILVY